MKRLIILFLGIIVGVLAVSCEKPSDDQGRENKDDSYTVTIGFNPPVEVQTRSGESYDNVDRLDVYCYDNNYNKISHEYFLGEDALSNRLSYTMESGASLYFYFFANLSEDLAEYIEQMDFSSIASRANFPFEEMDRLDYPMMASLQKVYFSEDQDLTVNLYRYTYSIDIGSITADFEVDAMKNKKITVKRIILTNCANNCDLIYSFTSELPSAIYGWKTQFEYEIFGGGSIGYEPGGALYSDGTQFTLKYENIKEEWAGEYNEIVNNNVINYYAGTVRTTDTGIVPKATIVTLDNENGEGILGQMDDGSLDNTIQINKTVTGLPGNYSEPKPINGGVSEQDHTPKLVIEVELDGQIMFYPIPIVAPQPNTIYHIEKITLKGAPSPYCNCYPVLYDISTGAIVSTMTETTVSDIIVGADPETGELI